jgi:hypothetical protein
MPATALTSQTASETGTVLAAAVNGDNVNSNSFINSGTTRLLLENTVASGATCTVAFPYKVRGQTIPALSITVPASGRVWCGPYDPTLYGDVVTITPSASTLKPTVLN